MDLERCRRRTVQIKLITGNQSVYRDGCEGRRQEADYQAYTRTARCPRKEVGRSEVRRQMSEIGDQRSGKGLTSRLRRGSSQYFGTAEFWRLNSGWDRGRRSEDRSQRSEIRSPRETRGEPRSERRGQRARPRMGTADSVQERIETSA